MMFTRNLKYRRLMLVAVLGLLMGSCHKKEIGPQSSCDNDVLLLQGELLIACEGLFNSNSASLSVYDIEESEVSNNVFSEVNGSLMGDVFQSISYDNGLYFFVVNNSQKIWVVDSASYQVVDEILLPNRSPRYMVHGENNLSYSSNLSLNPNGEPVYIDVIDKGSMAVIDSINVGVWVEEMIVDGNMLFACGMGASDVVVIDTDSREVVSAVQVGREPVSIVQDGNGDVWVLCTGGFEEELPSLWHIDVETLLAEGKYFTDIGMYPTRLIIDQIGEQLYFLNNGVYKMDVALFEIPVQAFIETGSNDFYGVGVGSDSEVYIGDANGFNGNGTVFRYNALGELITSFDVGTGPSMFYFADN